MSSNQNFLNFKIRSEEIDLKPRKNDKSLSYEIQFLVDGFSIIEVSYQDNQNQVNSGELYFDHLFLKETKKCKSGQKDLLVKDSVLHVRTSKPIKPKQRHIIRPNIITLSRSCQHFK